MGRDDVYPVKTFKVGLLHYFITRLWNSVVDRPWTSLLDMHHPDPWHAPVAATTVFSTPDAWRGKRPKHVDWTDYILLTNLMHWLLFIHKIIFSSTCFEPQVLIFRRIQLCKCSIWYCHSSWWPVGTQRELCTDWPPRTVTESDSTICCMYTTVSSWRWALEARNM